MHRTTLLIIELYLYRLNHEYNTLYFSYICVMLSKLSQLIIGHHSLRLLVAEGELGVLGPLEEVKVPHKVVGVVHLS